MRQVLKAAVIVAAALMTAGAGAKDEAPAQDPKAAALIAELGLIEAATPLRAQPGWRKPKRIVLSAQGPYNPSSTESMQAMKSMAPGVELVVVRGVEEMLSNAPTADALLGIDGLVCDERVLAAAKQARWIGIYSAGIEECLGKKGVDRPGLTVTNMRAVAGPVMAEHTIGLMFALSRSLQVSIARQATGEGWSNNFTGSRPQALSGKTLLVAGLGGIGQEVARRAHALGMKVIATRNSSREKPDYVSYVGLSDELPALIPQADVVVAALPLVPATTNLFDAKMFARMKPSAFFINVGRGGSVVTNDLVAALNAGTIAGAGLDVTEPEPLPKDHALWKAKNIIITPHMSAQSDLGQAARELILREQVRRFVAGDKLLAVVDFKKGY
jgi:phosphoglycerate dehydrogenase-like enzyme